MKNVTRHGFTILEVTIVLAIAGLIFVVVLLGAGALQRSQRTRAAEDAASRLLTALQDYTNNAGTPLAPNTNFPAGERYIENAKIPSYLGTPNPGNPDSGEAATDTNRIIFSSHATCDTSGNGKMAPGAATQYAVSYWSENASGPVCKQSG